MRPIKYRAKIVGSNSFVIGVPHNVYSEPSKEMIWFDSIQYLDANGKPDIEYISSDTIQEFTGFTDKNGEDIYEGDILSDKVEVDGKIINSKQTVFWNEPTGSWHLDNSYNQDQTFSRELWRELNDFEYEVAGNILGIPI